MEFSANRLVAYNLRRVRARRGWTQKEAAERVSRHLSNGWSRSVYSVAEGSATGQRVRQFDADELAALAAAFDVPVWWFFLPAPPYPPDASGEDAAWIIGGGAKGQGSGPTMRLAGRPMSFLEGLAWLLPAELGDVASELSMRAAAAHEQGQGLGQAIAETMVLLRDHVAAWQRELEGRTATEGQDGR